jgi:PBP1b-binding outer membrane lipoprotein LpoB
MKKMLVLMVALVGLTVMSCSNEEVDVTTEETVMVDSTDVVVVDTTVVDGVASTDSVVVEIK